MSEVISDKIDAEIEIDVECAECRSSLSTEFGRGLLLVSPCDECLRKAEDDGYRRGKTDGREEASQ